MKLQEDKARENIRLGSLAPNSAFAEDQTELKELASEKVKQEDDLSSRNFTYMARVLNPRPNARARWQRRQVIRHIRRGGRLTREMQIARTERKHLSRSHFFKTSMKKLAPLARQIAGKSLDEAILQMRFSKKQVAQEVREHLIQARNEAIAIKGMGIKPDSTLEATLPNGPLVLDPSITPPGPQQTSTKTRRAGVQADETDIYISEAWTNPGPYGRQPEFRARGRVNILRPPHTGLSVLLKEEKTRTRVKMEKELKAIKKRLGKSSWTQLPDRKVTNQLQHVLW
jgi:ribosomal protein L22